MSSFNKESWYQPSGPAKYGQNGWIKISEPKKVRFTLIDLFGWLMNVSVFSGGIYLIIEILNKIF